jgi:ABC-2 type transport system permease protein
MKILLFLIQKEFIQIFRNRTILPILFIVPIVQLVILVYAATLEMKNIDMFIVDKDLSSTSRRLVQKFENSPFFVIKQHSFSVEEGRNQLRKGNIDVILHIPANFEKILIREDQSKIQLLIDAINGTAAGLTNAYISGIIAGLNREIITEWTNVSFGQKLPELDITYSFWYNPKLNYKIFMLPAIMVLLVTVIGMILSALNLVREKELGTIEQINVTPIKKYQFIIGKLVPFWIIALIELSFGITVGKLFFDMPFLGNLFLLFLFASLYLFVVMGLSLFISTIAHTQQQVMFVAFFFLIVFILMSGIFTPVETMPEWAQKINLVNPLAYFMRVIRMIILKGSDFSDILKEIFIIGIFAVFSLSLAVWRYRKTV